MISRTKFLTVTAALSVLKQHYNHGETRSNITMQRGLKQGSIEFDSVKLSITGPVGVFIAIGGLIWGAAAALECHLSAHVYNGQATWELIANGEPEGVVAEMDEVARKAFGG